MTVESELFINIPGLSLSREVAGLLLIQLKTEVRCDHGMLWPEV